MRSTQRRMNKRQRTIVEPLDQRIMPTGNVLASLSQGALTVKGDTLDNHFEVTQAMAGTITIHGLDGTKVNGKETASFTGNLKDLDVQMEQGGTDQVEINGPFKVTGDLRAKLKQGSLNVEGTAGVVDIGRNLVVRAGTDAEVNVVNQVRVKGRTDIQTGGNVAVVAGAATVPDVKSARFSSSVNVNNPYFPLVPGTQYKYDVTGKDQETDVAFTEKIVVDVQSNTRTITGVQVVVVHDIVKKDGVLIEDTFDFYSQDDNGNVWYFGEDVTNYRYDDTGKLIGTDKDGSWEAGKNNAVAGIIMEATPRIGHKYYQEYEPGGPVDQAVGLATNQSVTVPFGSFSNVVQTRDTSVREPLGLGNKFFAQGIGSVQELAYNPETNEIFQRTTLTSVTINGVPVTQVVSPTGFQGTNTIGGSAKQGIELQGSVDIRAKGDVVVGNSTVRRATDIDAGKEVLLIDAVFSRSTSITAADIVTIRNTSMSDRTSIVVDADIFLWDSDFDKLRIRQGAGDNTLSIQGSNISHLTADGGAGINLFEDLGGNWFRKLLLRRFW